MRTVQDRYAAGRQDWADRRTNMPPFEQTMGDKIAAAKKAARPGDPGIFMPRFEAECQQRGVGVVVEEFEVETDHRKGRRRGDTEFGITYTMLDEFEPGKRPRRRRRSASKLSHEFTYAGLQGGRQGGVGRKPSPPPRLTRPAPPAQAAPEPRGLTSAQMHAVMTQMDSPASKPVESRTFAEMVAVIEARQAETQRQLDELKVTTGASGATAPASPGDSRSAAAPEEQEAPAPAVATAPSGPSDVATAPSSQTEQPYRSRVRDLLASTAKAVAVRDAWTEFDEDAYARLRAGQRLAEDRGDRRGAKGVGRRVLDTPVGHAFAPDVRAELENRVALAELATGHHEAGRFEEAGRLRSLIRRGIYEDVQPSVRKRLVVEMAAEDDGRAVEHDDRRVGD